MINDISNFLNLTTMKFDNHTHTWKDSQEHNTLAYNKKFRKKNLGKGKLGGVLPLWDADAWEEYG